MKLLLLSFLIYIAAAAPGWQLNFDQAKAEAQQSHKLILLNFSGSDWCGPCIKLKKDVFESPEFQAFAADHIVLVRADFPRLAKNQLDARQTAHNEALAEIYNKQGKFPFTVLLDASGRVLQEWDGYPKSLTPASFVAAIQKIPTPK
ncbi:MAG: thiol-disulfide isomerase [Spirosoma sp.]|nr:thiol-disulfide isomerase [Spirosoma sp.]